MGERHVISVTVGMCRSSVRKQELVVPKFAYFNSQCLQINDLVGYAKFGPNTKEETCIFL